MGLRENKNVDRSITITSWRELVTLEDTFGERCMFRGHSDDWDLKSTLHRACDRFGKGDYTEARSIEESLMRDFRRQYAGEDAQRVAEDPMYCLAKMQHHGAPTRLLDWTYSFFVALFFAMEGAHSGKDAFIWAFNYAWVNEKQRELGMTNWRIRNIDETRGRADLFEDTYFVQQNRMVFVESALPLNSRLADQQGVFLMPGVVSETIDSVLDALLNREGVIQIIRLRFNEQEFAKVLTKLHRMRLTYRSVYADTAWYGRDLIFKIPTLGIRTRSIAGGALS